LKYWTGATRNFEALKRAEEQAEREDKAYREELENNPMKLLEVIYLRVFRIRDVWIRIRTGTTGLRIRTLLFNSVNFLL
jgi:hypothetical protein